MILFVVERVVVTWEGSYEDAAVGGAEQPWIALAIQAGKRLMAVFGCGACGATVYLNGHSTTWLY